MVSRHRLFIRRRDKRIEVLLNDVGRNVVREAVARVVAAEQDPNHEWRASLESPIDPSNDEDDPVAKLSRQHEVATNAELALLTVDEQFLNDAEAWAWLTTLQVALRSTAVSHGLLSDEKLAQGDAEVLTFVRTLQHLLFDLADCL